MRYLSDYGQQPQVMVVSCCDSRVDPALILQCDPGDLFVARNVANIIPPYEIDEAHHGTSAALEFGICYLEVKHLILLGHSQCGGIQALLKSDGKRNESSLDARSDDFITNWVSLIKTNNVSRENVDDCAKSALKQSLLNCLTFPWIRQRVTQGKLNIHLWFFDIQTGQIFAYSDSKAEYEPLHDPTIG